MTRIYLLRHGQTLFNQKNLIQGSCDSKLTAKGIAQAKAVYDDDGNLELDGNGQPIPTTQPH